MTNDIHAVTGAFGYSGKYIARRLLEQGHEVITLTNSPDRPDPFGGKMEACPLNFADRHALTASLRGVSVLYNTYWVRFNHRLFTFADAARNTKRLFEAAKAAYDEIKSQEGARVMTEDSRTDLEYVIADGVEYVLNACDEQTVYFEEAEGHAALDI